MFSHSGAELRVLSLDSSFGSFTYRWVAEGKLQSPGFLISESGLTALFSPGRQELNPVQFRYALQSVADGQLAFITMMAAWKIRQRRPPAGHL